MPTQWQDDGALSARSPADLRTTVWLVALVAAVLVVYPALRRQMSRTQSAARARAAEAAMLIEQSLEHARAARFQECVDTAEQAVGLNPNAAAAYNNLGFCLASLKLWDDAIPNAEEAVRLDPALRIAQNNLVWMRQEKLKAGGSKDR